MCGALCDLLTTPIQAIAVSWLMVSGLQIAEEQHGCIIPVRGLQAREGQQSYATAIVLGSPKHKSMVLFTLETPTRQGFRSHVTRLCFGDLGNAMHAVRTQCPRSAHAVQSFVCR